VLDRARKALPEAGFAQAYGMTELGPVATLLLPADHDVNSSYPDRLGSGGGPPRMPRCASWILKTGNFLGARSARSWSAAGT
jgi:hypothetical protein